MNWFDDLCMHCLVGRLVSQDEVIGTKEALEACQGNKELISDWNFNTKEDGMIRTLQLPYVPAC